MDVYVCAAGAFHSVCASIYLVLLMFTLAKQSVFHFIVISFVCVFHTHTQTQDRCASWLLGRMDMPERAYSFDANVSLYPLGSCWVRYNYLWGVYVCVCVFAYVSIFISLVKYLVFAERQQCQQQQWQWQWNRRDEHGRKKFHVHKIPRKN